ncbi:uncharacterized protein TNCV_4196041 [Trichonephila clavipes]|nr:uncharacterized protein TNCV_4196041 [Trichonephila clavipes]
MMRKNQMMKSTKARYPNAGVTNSHVVLFLCCFSTSTSAIKVNSFLRFTCRNCGGGDRGRVAIYRPFGAVSLSLNRTVTCMVLKANDRRTSCPCHDEFRGPRSDYARQVALATTTTTLFKSIENIPYATECKSRCIFFMDKIEKEYLRVRNQKCCQNLLVSILNFQLTGTY